jgi:hypothetical protein
METLVWAGIAGVAAMVPPVRERVLAVTKATITVGTGLAGAALKGIRDIANAAVEGESAASTSAGTKRPARAGKAS